MNKAHLTMTKNVMNTEGSSQNTLEEHINYIAYSQCNETREWNLLYYSIFEKKSLHRKRAL